MDPAVGSLLLGEVLPRVLTIAVAIAAGVTLANVLVSFGAIQYIAVLSKPLTARFSEARTLYSNPSAIYAPTSSLWDTISTTTRTPYETISGNAASS